MRGQANDKARAGSWWSGGQQDPCHALAQIGFKCRLGDHSNSNAGVLAWTPLEAVGKGVVASWCVLLEQDLGGERPLTSVSWSVAFVSTMTPYVRYQAVYEWCKACLRLASCRVEAHTGSLWLRGTFAAFYQPPMHLPRFCLKDCQVQTPDFSCGPMWLWSGSRQMDPAIAAVTVPQTSFFCWYSRVPILSNGLAESCGCEAPGVFTSRSGQEGPFRLR
jgi:hypothetical protein